MIALVVLLGATAWAGPWVRSPGHGYAQLGVGYARSGARFTEQGERLPLTDPTFVPDNFEQVFESGAFHQVEAQLYTEVGVLPSVEVFGALPVRHALARWDFARGSDVLRLRQVAFGDALLGAKVGRAAGPVVAALSASVRVPLYDNDPEVLGIEPGNADIYDDRPPVGPGTVDTDLLAAVGTGGGRGWAQLEAGIRLRNRQFGAQLPVRAQAGARLGPLAGFAEVELLLPLTDGAAPDAYLDAFNKGPLALDRQRHVRPAVGVLWASSRPGLAPGALLRVDTLATGRRTAATTTVTAAATLAW